MGAGRTEGGVVRRRAAVAISALVVAAAALALPSGAGAHPLGNFTVNHYAGIELAGNRAYVHLVLDLAEIPTFQTGDRVREAGYAATLARELELRLDGARVALRPVSHRLAMRQGAGGLPTLRFEAVYVAPLTGSVLAFSDRSYGSRIGWREITLVARDGARVLHASVPATSRSHELRAYPRELLRSPLDVRSATSRFEGGDAAGAPPSLGPVRAPDHRGSGFEALVDDGDLSAGVVGLSLLVAVFWGAAHALTPGHGKALVAGYLVGARGRPRHAFLLGGTVTVTHTAGVFALGLVTLLLSRFVVPERLYPWLTLVSGVLVVAVGLGVLRSRLTGRRRHAHDHAHGRHHEHPHEHEDSHDLSSRGLVGVGIAAGLLPCPSALVVLLSAIALHRVAFGLALILAFSLGLAATVTGIGLVAVLARRVFARAGLDGPLVRALPAVSAAVIVLAGIAITAKALPGVV
jgi:ABC-type nickel/cobalt efflux system permease component RcnA